MGHKILQQAILEKNMLFSGSLGGQDKAKMAPNCGPLTLFVQLLGPMLAHEERAPKTQIGVSLARNADMVVVAFYVCQGAPGPPFLEDLYGVDTHISMSISISIYEHCHKLCSWHLRTKSFCGPYRLCGSRVFMLVSFWGNLPAVKLHALLLPFSSGGQ